MPDPRFESVFLEGLPRRDEFRAARARLEDGCGNLTLAGDLGLLAAGDPGEDAPTLPAAAALAFFLRDGDRLHPLAVGVNTVGRLPDNTVVLKDGHVSRRHCAVVVHRDGRCELHDVASKNGTLLNGAKIDGPTPLRVGDTITLCDRRLTLVAAGPG